MTKILLSLLTIVLAAGVAIGASGAWFRDTETTTGNTFTAGIIDLQVDCSGDTVFSPMDEPLPLIFDYLPPKDIKPGFSGEVTLSMHLTPDSNNADLWMDVLNLQNFGGDNPDREQEVEAVNGVDDDISVHILTKVWLDQGSIAGWQNDPAIDPEEGNNIYDVGEPLYYDGNIEGLEALGNFTVKQNADASTAYYIGWSWSLPTTVGNEHQGDYCTFDIVFGADQVTTYNVATLVVPGGGSVILTPPGGTYDAGTEVTVTADPALGYAFTGWSGDLTGNTNPQNLVVDSDKSVTAHFIARYDLTTSASPTEGGSVTGAGTYDDGEDATITASPANACWYFINWTGSGVDAGKVGNVTNPVTTITMDNDYSVQANFAKYQYTLGTTVNGTGNITLTPPGGTYDCGTVVTVSATTNDPCWHFTGWSQDLGGSVTPQDITINGNKNVTATFAKYQYDLTVNAGTGGTTDPSGTSSRECGSDVSVSATPDSCYQFTGWTGDVPSGHENDNPVSIHIDGAKTINATFAKISYNLTVNAGTGGTTSPSGTSSRECGSDVSVSANPDSGYEFDYWSGDVPGGHENDNPVSIHMDSAKTITANFKSTGPTEITLSAIKDSYVYSGSSGDDNFGTATLMNTGSSDTYRGLVAFDLSGIPSGATIDSATLKLYCDDTNVSSGTASVWAHRITGTWTEGGVTWDNQPGVASSSNTAGASATSWTNWDVTTDVQTFVDGTYTNYGWGIRRTSDLNGYANFRTREYTGTDYDPQLVVTYHVPETATLSALKDSYIDRSNSGTNYGTLTFMSTGNSSSGNDRYRGVVAFDLSSIPSGATVESATLSLYCANRSSSAPTISEYRITDSWTETGVTWTNTASDYTGSGNDATPSASSWTSWNVTSDVQSFVNGTNTNNGWMLRNTSSTSRWATFSTKEVGSNVPVLVVKYHMPFTLTTAVSPGASGTISLNPPGGTYDTGTVVTVTATAAVGYAFDHWSGDLTGSTNPESITMDTNKSITATFVPTTTTTLYTTKDSYVYEGSSGNDNFGTDTNIRVSQGSGAIRRGLIQFDLSSLAGAIIDSAELRLYCYQQDNWSGGPYDVSAYLITGSWTESGVGGVTWGTRPDPQTPSSATATVSVPNSDGWRTWDVTSDVQAFANGTYTNYGWYIKKTSETSYSRGVYFRSSEYSDANYVPVLVVTYH